MNLTSLNKFVIYPLQKLQVLPSKLTFLSGIINPIFQFR